MQHDNHDMDKKLRQLENQSLPDLSKMDEHWQQLRNSLQPGTAPTQPKTGWKKNGWRWMIAASVTSILILLTYKWLTPTPKDQILIQAPSPVFKSPETVTDTTDIPAITKEKEDQKEPVPGHQPVLTVTPRRTNTPKPSGADDPFVPSVNNTPLPAPADPQATLDQFFGGLEKPAQEFVINSRRDTVIRGLDGTALLIRAHTFSSQSPVTIILKEYYSYEDIVTNRLTTVSNNNQLVSGGMIHLMAIADGREVNIQPGKAIRWFVPDTTAEMKQMQLFVPETQPTTAALATKNGTYNSDITLDTSAIVPVSSINWLGQNQSFTSNFLMTMVKVLDLRDYPFKVSYGKKVKARFYMNRTSKLGREELKALLLKKYPKYDKIVIRKAGKRDVKEGYFKRYNLLGQLIGEDYAVSVGDSAWLDPRQAEKFKLPASDTVAYWSSARFVQNDFFRSAELRQIAGRYSVDITSLGWINCDRFYNDNRPKISFVVNLPDTASSFSTLLVFDRIKSVMAGVVYGKRVMFFNVPEGETAKVISVGVRDNKTVSALQNVVLSRQPLTNLQFEETDPSGFKKEVAKMDKPSGNRL